MFIWIVAAVLLLLAPTAIHRSGRKSLLKRLRAEWGTRVDRKRDTDVMAASHRSRLSEARPATQTSADRSPLSLDDRTWDDLNFDDVFAAIDQTTSTLGQHAVYHRLRTAHSNDELQAFEALVQRMTDDSAARERAQMALARLQDPQGYDVWWLASPDAVAVPAWYVAFPLMTVATLVLLFVVLVPLRPALIPLLAALLLASVAIRFATARRVQDMVRAFRQVAPIIATAEELQFLEAPDIDPLVGPIRAEAPRLGRLKNIARWISEDPLMISVGRTTLEIVTTDFYNLVYLYLNLTLHLDENGLYFASRDIRRHGEALVRIVAALGEIDAAISVASYRASRAEWTRPRFRAPGEPAVLTDLRHPLLADAVPNTITLNAANGVLVTGSNMSGKSTFLRTVGVATVMAQTINTCLASAYDAPAFHVMSCIGRGDDILAGKSYYLVEVEALLELVRASADTSAQLFLLDELFRGTNAVERIAAGQAVLAELVAGHGGRSPHVVIAATHDNELVELLQEQFAPYHFEDDIGPDGLVFNHRLQAGPATTRNAIALLRLEGAPESLVTRALSCAEALDRQRGTTLTAR